MRKIVSGQSFIEYVILVAVILGAVMATVGPLKSAIKILFEKSAKGVDVIADEVGVTN